MNDWTDLLPPMLAGEALNNRLACYPKYDPEIRSGSASERLLGLSSLYDIYIPGTLSVEVYSKLYLATHRSLAKKQAKKTVTLQLVENRRRLQYTDSNGIIGGADSFIIVKGGYKMMTWNEICSSDRLFLQAKDICGSVFPVSEKTLRKQAKQDSASLGFPVCIIGEKVFFPRKAFIAYVESFQPRTTVDDSNHRQKG